MSDVTDHNGIRPGGAEQLHDEPVVVEDPFLEQRQQQLKVAVGAGAVAALVAYLLWRLKIRRTPPTPSERLTEAAGRAAEVVQSKAAKAAPTGERLLDATKHLGGASLAVSERARDKISDAAGPIAGSVADTASDVASKAADVGQTVGSGIAAVPDVVADAAHEVHKFWRKWTLRILWVLAAGIGYTAGAAAGRERYEQIVGAAKGVAGRPEVQQAQAKAQQKVKEAVR